MQSSGGGESASTFQAAPRLRNMQKEVTRFVPTAVKVGHSVVGSTAAKRKAVSAGGALYGNSDSAATKVPAVQGKVTSSTDDAYSKFMQEMKGLL